MKIALLGPYPLAPAGTRGEPPLPGGVEAVVVALARGLAARPDIELRVITAIAGLTEPVYHPAEGYTAVAVPRPRGGRLTGQRAVVRHLRAQIASFAPQIVHAHSAGIYARAALASGLPALITLHGVIYRELQQAWPTSAWGARLRWASDALMERAVVRQARAVTAISPYILTAFAGQLRGRVHPIENPVADRFFAVGGQPTDAERLLYVGRVIPRKGITTLLAAFAQVAAIRPAATLTLVGETDSDPTYAQTCRTLAAQLGVSDRVIFTGAQTPNQVADHYAAADLVLLASEQETAPVSIAEALAAGRPVIATDVGGCAAMLTDGVTGRIVPPRDPGALAAAAAELLADGDRLRRMGQAARQAAEARFRLHTVVQATMAAYRQVVEDPTP